MTTENQAEQQASESQIDLEAILKDPLSLPEGADLEAFASENPQDQEDRGIKDSEKQGETSSDAPGAQEQNAGEGDPRKEQNAQGENTQESQEDGQEAVIVSKNGKHTIPYNVLKEEREKRARAELMAQELTARLEAMKHQQETGQLSKTNNISDIVDPELLKDLREESPLVAETIDKLITQNQELSKEISKQAQAHEEVGRDAKIDKQVQVIMTLEEAIASVPKLNYIRATDTERYQDMVAIDDALRTQTQWKDKPLEERFAAVVKMYEVANGEIVLPGQEAPKQQPTDEAKRVEEAVKKAQAQKQAFTLSDIPGGVPAANEQDAVGDMSSAALTAKMMDMTPEQIEAMLARLS